MRSRRVVSALPGSNHFLAGRFAAPGSVITRKQPSGFTLLEILLVTVILSILISMVTVQFRRSFDNIQFKNFVLDLQSILRYAHDKAVLEKDVYLLRFVENPQGYRLEKSSGTGSDGKEDFKQIKDRTGATRLLPKNTEAKIDPPLIEFYPDGSATQALWEFKDSKGHATSFQVHPEIGEVTTEDSNV